MQVSKLKRIKKIGLFLLMALIVSMALIWLFEKRFDADSWQAEPLERYQMVDDIIESQLLIDKTKDEVVLMLGKPNRILSKDKDVFVYKLGTPPSFFDEKPEQLLIIFELEKVAKVTLAIE